MFAVVGQNCEYEHETENIACIFIYTLLTDIAIIGSLMLFEQFHFVCVFTSGQISVMDYLINELEVDPLAKDNGGMTTVHVATQNQMFEAIKVIYTNKTLGTWVS